MPASDQLSHIERYQLIPRTLIFVTCGKHVLMVKGAPGKRLWANLYNGLGGHIERGESVLGAARRELLEESGLDVGVLRLVGVVTVDTGESPGIGLYVLRCDLPEENGLPLTESNTEGTLEWIALQDLHRLPLVEDLITLLPVVMTVDTGDVPFSATYEYQGDGRLVIEFDSV
jgi:8-oxo-dGTP diphosphatase